MFVAAIDYLLFKDYRLQKKRKKLAQNIFRSIIFRVRVKYIISPDPSTFGASMFYFWRALWESVAEITDGSHVRLNQKESNEPMYSRIATTWIGVENQFFRRWWTIFNCKIGSTTGYHQRTQEHRTATTFTSIGNPLETLNLLSEY